MAAHFGLPNSADLPADLKTELNAFIAEALREIYRRAKWPFLDYHDRIRLYAADDDGTVSVTAGGTAWTGSSTSWDTSWSGNIRIRADGEEYRVSTIGSTTSLTTTDSALSTLSGEDYYLFICEYCLGATLKHIGDMWLVTPDERLQEVSPSEMASMRTRQFYIGHPKYWCQRGVNSNGYPEIELYPVPGFDEILHVNGTKAGTIPSADSDTDDVPDEFSDVVDKLARARMFLYKNDPRYSVEAPVAERALLMMVQQASVNRGVTRISLDPEWYGMKRPGQFKKAGD